MIISCPKCFTRYKVPEASLGAMGRVVKCKNCGHKWHQNAPQQQTPQNPQQESVQGGQNFEGQASQKRFEQHQPAEKAPVAPLPQQHQDEQLPQAQGLPALHTSGGKKTLPLWVGMAMGAGLTLGVLGAGFVLKDPLTKAMPAMAKILNAESPTERLATEQADTQGLVVENVQRDILEEGGFTTYVISGEVVNTNMKNARVPNLEVSLLDERGNLIDQWRVQPKTSALSAGESTNWICYFYNPPLAKVSEYKINFVN